MMNASDLDRRLGALRQAFDSAFARPFVDAGIDTVDLLEIASAGRPWAVLAADIAGVHAGKAVVSLPSRARGCLGVANFRGVLAVVFDLGTLLGDRDEPPHLRGPARWLLLSKDGTVAFVIDELEGYTRVPSTSLAERDTPDAGRSRRVVTMGPVTRRVVDVAALVMEIRQASDASEDRGEIEGT